MDYELTDEEIYKVYQKWEKQPATDFPHMVAQAQIAKLKEYCESESFKKTATWEIVKGSPRTLHRRDEMNCIRAGKILTQILSLIFGKEVEKG